MVAAPMVGVVGLEPTTLNPQSSGSTAELHPDGPESNRRGGRAGGGVPANASRFPVDPPPTRISSIDQGQGLPGAASPRSAGLDPGIGTDRGPDRGEGTCDDG